MRNAEFRWTAHHPCTSPSLSSALAGYYPFMDHLVEPLPGGKVLHAAYETAIEQFVFCPIATTLAA